MKLKDMWLFSLLRLTNVLKATDWLLTCALATSPPQSPGGFHLPGLSLGFVRVVLRELVRMPTEAEQVPSRDALTGQVVVSSLCLHR